MTTDVNPIKHNDSDNDRRDSKQSDVDTNALTVVERGSCQVVHYQIVAVKLIGAPLYVVIKLLHGPLLWLGGWNVGTETIQPSHLCL